jgi:hypothetical protein
MTAGPGLGSVTTPRPVLAHPRASEATNAVPPSRQERQVFARRMSRQNGQQRVCLLDGLLRIAPTHPIGTLFYIDAHSRKQTTRMLLLRRRFNPDHGKGLFPPRCIVLMKLSFLCIAVEALVELVCLDRDATLSEPLVPEPQPSPDASSRSSLKNAELEPVRVSMATQPRSPTAQGGMVTHRDCARHPAKPHAGPSANAVLSPRPHDADSTGTAADAPATHTANINCQSTSSVLQRPRAWSSPGYRQAADQWGSRLPADDTHSADMKAARIVQYAPWVHPEGGASEVASERKKAPKQPMAMPRRGDGEAAYKRWLSTLSLSRRMRYEQQLVGM